MSFSKEFKSALKGALFTSPEWSYDVQPTGLVGLDEALVAGGFGEGRINEIYGRYSSAKTVVLYLWLIENQKRGGMSFLFESEGGFHHNWFMSQGGIFDTGTDADLHLKPDLGSVEEFFDSVNKIIDVVKKHKIDVPIAIGWDSLAATACKANSKKNAGEAYAGKKAAIISEEGAKLLSRLQGTRITVTNTNQTRTKPGAAAWEETHTPGGASWPYNCSSRVELEWDGGPSGSKILNEKDDNTMIGRFIRGKVVKNKLGEPFRTFKFPVYSVGEVPHPLFENATTVLGIDKAEALLYWYLDNPHAKHKGSGERFVLKKGGGRNQLNPVFFGDSSSFLKKEWLTVLANNAILATPREIHVD